MNKKPMVYICSPLRASTEEGIKRNMEKAKDYMDFVSKRYGCRAVAPHAYLPQFLDDYTPEER